MILGCCLAYRLFRRPKKAVPGELPTPPGPWGWPIIGNLPQMGRTPHKALTDLWTVYGDVYKIQLGSRPTIVLNGLDTIRKALVKQAEDFAGRPNFYTFNFIANGKSMGFSDYGERWKIHRRIAQNALSMFINSADNPMQRNIQSEAEVLASQLLELGEQGPVDPHNQIYMSVGNIICALCFGRRYKRDDPEFLQLIKNNDEFMAYAGAGNPVDIMPWMRHLTKRSFTGFCNILRVMDNFCLKKRQEHMQTYDPTRMRDVTDALLRAADEISEGEKTRVGLTNEHILVTVQELIGAGFDTTATTLQWSLLFMTMNADIQARVQAEVDLQIGDNMPTYGDQQNLPFTEAVLLETMRFSCIFPFALPHSTTCDTTLNGFFIPDKTLVFVNLWSVTRDPRRFPDPDVFNPFRFLSEDGQTLNKVRENFLPFGAGRRKCPGELLGRMEVFMFFTFLMQKCTFMRVPGMQYTLESKYGLTLKPKDFKMIVKPRKR